MSRIDSYSHRVIGFIKLPPFAVNEVSFPFSEIAIYELLENIPGDEADFDGKVGDVLVGGGSGESPAFRISIPEAIIFWYDDEYKLEFKNYNELFKTFWNPTESFQLCTIYKQYGWRPDIDIEFWLSEIVCNYLKNTNNLLKKYRKSFTTKYPELMFKTIQI